MVVPTKLKNKGSPKCVRARTMEKIGTEEGTSTDAREIQSKANNVSSWYCDGSEKGATDSTSLLFEASKSKINVYAGKGGEDRGREEETGGCPRLAVSQTRLELKKEKKRGFYWEGGKEMD